MRRNPFREHENANPELKEYYLLLKAISSHNLEKVKELLQQNKDIVKPKSPWNDWPLSVACKKGNYEIVVELLQYGANPSAGFDSKPLIEAAIANKVDIIRLLVEYGADLEQYVEDNETAIYWAVFHDNFQAVQCLVELGANVNFRSSADGDSPLSMSNNTAIYDLLLPLTDEQFR